MGKHIRVLFLCRFTNISRISIEEEEILKIHREFLLLETETLDWTSKTFSKIK